MATSCHAPASVKRCISRTPSGNPLPRRGQVKEKIAKHIITAVATAAMLACDKAGGGKKGGDKPPAVAGAKKK